MKNELGESFIDDLKIVNKIINKMFMNERYAYKIKLDETKMRFFKDLKKVIFRDLYIKVSPFTLKQMLSQYLKVVNHDIQPCIKTFIIIMRLLYAHVMKQRMQEAVGVLKLKDIHFH